MKRLIVGFLASVGFLALLLAAVLVAGGVYVMRLAERPPPVPERALLTIDLRGKLEERLAELPLGRWGPTRRLSHPEILLALDAASRDPRVHGVFVRLEGDGPGLARAQELASAFRALRAAGKVIVAHADTFGELTPGNVGYMLASAADEIHLQPVGLVGLTGIVIETPFFRETLEEIGVEPDFTKREVYKTALDMATETGLTPANREMLDSLASSLFDQMVEAIATGRDMEPAAVRRLVDGGPYLAEEALAAGLVDRIGYRDEARERAQELAGGAEPFGIDRYASGLAADEEASEAIAIVHGIGLIQPGRERAPGIGGFMMNADGVARAIADAAADPEVRAILLRIDSGGGSAVASETIAREVRRARAAGKPVIATMAEAAASGGYWIAMDASAVIAAEATLTGSIGVIAGKPVAGELASRLGVAFGRIQRGANADMWSIIEPFNAHGRARLETLVDGVYGSFLDGVARGRGLDRQEVERVARGRVWTGAQAIGLGLIDGTGGFLEALARARVEAGLEPEAAVRLRPFPRPRHPLQAMLDLLELPGIVSAALARILPLVAALGGSAPASAPALVVR